MYNLYVNYVSMYVYYFQIGKVYYFKCQNKNYFFWVLNYRFEIIIIIFYLNLYYVLKIDNYLF